VNVEAFRTPMDLASLLVLSVSLKAKLVKKTELVMKQKQGVSKKKVGAFVDRQCTQYFHPPWWLGACANICVLEKALVGSATVLRLVRWKCWFQKSV
jgi:hypothetical protein